MVLSISISMGKPQYVSAAWYFILFSKQCAYMVVISLPKPFTDVTSHLISINNSLWVELHLPKRYFEVLTPRTCEWDLIWK